MELAQPASTNVHPFSPPAPIGYQALGPSKVVAKTASKVCLRAGSATVEVTALAPDLFRVGFFPNGRAVNYRSVAVVPRNWDAGPIAVVEGENELTMTTARATAHLSLNPLRIPRNHVI